MAKPTPTPALVSAAGLFIGINDYPGSDSDLAGCVNDANDWAKTLACKRKTVLLDSDATKKNIVSAMRSLLASLVSGDLGIITYSGHGSWLPDEDGDEPDGRDECLVNYDFDNDILLDDEIYQILLAKPIGTKVLFITDSCHSGTVYRMHDAHQETRTKVRFLSPHKLMSARKWNKIEPKMQLLAAAPVSHKRALPDVIHISGCQDDEYSYDTYFGRRPNGAMTYHAINTLERGSTYQGWYTALRTKLPSADTPQTPLLNATAEDQQLKVPV